MSCYRRVDTILFNKQVTQVRWIQYLHMKLAHSSNVLRSFTHLWAKPFNINLNQLCLNCVHEDCLVSSRLTTLKFIRQPLLIHLYIYMDYVSQ